MGQKLNQSWLYVQLRMTFTLVCVTNENTTSEVLIFIYVSNMIRETAFSYQRVKVMII